MELDDKYSNQNEVYVHFGKYPQRLVMDSAIISILKSITITNKLGYIELNGKEYKKDNDKYYLVEPICWKVFSYYHGAYEMISELILDVQPFYSLDDIRLINNTSIYPNNYEFSNVRAWLNGYNGTRYDVPDYTNNGFINIAFSEAERNFINTTLVDNSASTTDNSSNSYTCLNTNDKVYLLSYKDMLNTTYGFSSSYSNYDTNRSAIVTDYARSKGCYMSTSSDYYGKGRWWLRSPYYYSSLNASSVNCHGYVIGGNYVNYSYYGVRPALEITI